MTFIVEANIDELYQRHLEEKNIKETSRNILANEGIFNIFKSKKKEEIKPQLTEIELLERFKEFFKNKKQTIQHSEEKEFSLKIKGFGNVKNSTDFLKAVEYQFSIIKIVEDLYSKELTDYKEGIEIIKKYISNSFSNEKEMFDVLTKYNNKRDQNYVGIFKSFVRIKDNNIEYLFDKFGVVKINYSDWVYKNSVEHVQINPENYEDLLNLTPFVMFSYVQLNIREIVFDKNDFLKVIDIFIKFIDTLISFYNNWYAGSKNNLFRKTSGVAQDLSNQISKEDNIFCEEMTIFSYGLDENCFQGNVQLIGDTLVDAYLLLLKHFTTENN